VIGAFFLTRRTVFERLQGFDERFFVYFEEVDFALRAREAGWSNVCLTDVTCIHAGGGTSRQVKSERLFYSLRSRLLYGFKHFSLLSAVALLAVTVMPEFLSRLFYSLARGARQDVWHTVRGYSMLIQDMPAIYRVAVGMRKQYK
jgi:GT2 family glycosyltransferase